ncbi:MAG TPA: VOC family protein [Thermomicrobiales bacterium]|nr:VOC family protein [Thermomicrobiales bacterium]
MAIATWAAVNIDCADPKMLGEFYRDLAGLPLHEQEGFYYLGDDDGLMIFLQQVDGYVAPTWPTQERGQQMHLDFRVDDLDQAVAEAEKLGATVAPEQPGTFWKVLLDPEGHPFCLAQTQQ